jgi:hypothetical protein
MEDTMKKLFLAAIAVLSLGAGSAYAEQPAQPQTSTEYPLINQGTGGPAYQRNLPANPAETRHVIGGETFYYDPVMNGGGGDGGAGGGGSD